MDLLTALQRGAYGVSVFKSKCGNTVTLVAFAAFSFGGREPRQAMALPRDGVETAARWQLRF